MKLHPHGSSCDIGLVKPNHVHEVWDIVYEHLLRMSPHSEGELKPDDFYDLLVEGEMQLWIAVEDGNIIASMVSQVVPYPRKRVLRIISIGGEDMDKWIDNLPLVEEWALEMGCTALECWGRKGWLKVLTDWKCSYHILTKDLTHRVH